jgi:hypothetical protein
LACHPSIEIDYEFLKFRASAVNQRRQDFMGHFHSSVFGLRGTMISRRPYRRASMENAPGPMQQIAIAMMVVKPEASLKMPAFALNRESKGTATAKLTRAATAEVSVVQ